MCACAVQAFQSFNIAALVGVPFLGTPGAYNSGGSAGFSGVRVLVTLQALCYWEAFLIFNLLGGDDGAEGFYSLFQKFFSISGVSKFDLEARGFNVQFCDFFHFNLISCFNFSLDFSDVMIEDCFQGAKSHEGSCGSGSSRLH